MANINTTISVIGVKEAVKHLEKCEPGFRKAYVANMKSVARPMTDAMKNSYSDNSFPSGTQRNWAQRGTPKFPLTAAGAKRGVALRVNNKKGKSAAISVMQKNPAAAIFDIAGRSNSNPLGMAFTQKFGRSASRVIWPAFEANISEVIVEVQKIADEVMVEVNKNLKVM
jgi:hypothetical protein